MFNLSTTEEDYPDVTTELKTARVRLQLAQAWSQLMITAFDAQLSYGVNYRTIPEYADTSLLDEGNRLNLVAGQEKFMEWMRRVEHGIKAAIRRKQFTLHHNRT